LRTRLNCYANLGSDKVFVAVVAEEVLAVGRDGADGFHLVGEDETKFPGRKFVEPTVFRTLINTIMINSVILTDSFWDSAINSIIKTSVILSKLSFKSKVFQAL
jgi:hypothetical protein